MKTLWFVLCVISASVVLVQVKCLDDEGQLVLESYLLPEAFCQIQCLKEKGQAGACAEAERCLCPNTTSETLASFSLSKIRNEEDLLELKPVCRDDTIVSLNWRLKRKQNEDRHFVFIVEAILQSDEANTTQFQGLTPCNFIVINGLSPDTSYTIQVWALDDDKFGLYGPFSLAYDTSSVTALPPVENVFLDEQEVVDNASYSALVRWKPQEEDPACFYDIVVMWENDFADYRQIEIRTVDTSHSIRLHDLYFETNYSFAIMSKSRDWMRESAKTWLNFTTPACLESLGSLDFCVPELVLDLRCEETPALDGLYDVAVRWREPKYRPDYYVVSLFVLLPDNITEYQRNVSGKATLAMFSEIDIPLHYQVSVVALSAAGVGKASILYKEISRYSKNSRAEDTLWVTLVKIGLAALFVLIIGIAGFSVLRRPKKRFYVHNMLYNDEKSLRSEPTRAPIPKDEWELDRDNIAMSDVLGEGAFGRVLKGTLTKDHSTTVQVAIKMLKDNPSSDEIRDLHQEIEIMKSVGKHPHLVSMIGCCSVPHLRPLLVVEYCSKGDLRSYLRDVYDIYTEVVHSESVSNKTYELQGLKDELYSYSRQVALAMEYLSSMRIVHRDLACRNILLCDDRIVKVADFGLSRDVYELDMYLKTGRGKLPVKWLALESLIRQQYTTHSDVWSFGIVLYEIFSLGGDPYPGAGAGELVEMLVKGERLECPQFCTQDVYLVMLACWSERPSDRPTFTQLKSTFEKFLENQNSYTNLVRT